ncbi:MAG: zinc ribbon domain-containing protein [Caldilineaceae bacterium]
MAVPNLWRTQKQRYSLQGAICPTCNTTIFPPRAHCPTCAQAEAKLAAKLTWASDNAAAMADPAFSIVFHFPQNADLALAGDD